VIPSTGSHPLPEPSGGRGALLKDIQKGTNLKPVIMHHFMYFVFGAKIEDYFCCFGHLIFSCFKQKHTDV